MRLKDSRLLSPFALPLVLLTGCGPSNNDRHYTTPPPAATFAYAVSSVKNNIAGYSVSPSTGALTQLTGFPITTAIDLTALAIDPLGKFVVTNESPGLVVYSINQTTGALTSASSTSITTAQSFGSFAFNPAGTLLVVSTLKEPDWDPPYQGAPPPNPNPIYVFSVNRSSGSLTAVPGSPFAISSDASIACCVAFNANSTMLYATDGHLLDAFSVDPTTGALSPINSVPVTLTDFLTNSVEPSSLALDSAGGFIYLTGSGANTIDAFSINPTTGALSAGPISTTADTAAALITLDPAHNLAFTSEASSPSSGSYTDIKTYSISNGKLTNISSISAPMSPQALQLGPSGSFLYAAEDNAYLGSVGSTSQVATYSIGAAGSLSPLATVPTVQWPSAFAIAQSQ